MRFAYFRLDGKSALMLGSSCTCSRTSGHAVSPRNSALQCSHSSSSSAADWQFVLFQQLQLHMELEWGVWRVNNKSRREREKTIILNDFHLSPPVAHCRDEIYETSVLAEARYTARCQLCHQQAPGDLMERVPLPPSWSSCHWCFGCVPRILSVAYRVSLLITRLSLQ